ncbi:unnamed protein product [Calypogeia fissa]
MAFLCSSDDINGASVLTPLLSPPSRTEEPGLSEKKSLTRGLRDLRAGVRGDPLMVNSSRDMKEQRRERHEEQPENLARDALTTCLYGALFGLLFVVVVLVVVVTNGAIARGSARGVAQVVSPEAAAGTRDEGSAMTAEGVGVALWDEVPEKTAQVVSTWTEECIHPSALTPLDVPKVSELEQFQGEHRERLYWGTYRSWAYLGIRARAKESLLAGLMWAGVDHDGQYLGLRHYCEDEDNLSRWSWLRHDGSTYGRQVLVDHGLVVTTYFLKSSEECSGYGGDWVVRVKVEEEKKPLKKITEEGRTQSVFFYIADEAGGIINLFPDTDNSVEDKPFAGGHADEIGSWELHTKYTEGVALHYSGLRQLYMPNLTQTVQDTLDEQKIATGHFRLPGSSVVAPNVALVQLTGILPFEVDMIFVSGVEKRAHRIQKLTGTLLDERLGTQEMEFEERFNRTFNLQGKVDTEEELETAKVALSNMIGGIGYFYGQSRIQKPPECLTNSSVDYWLYWNASLYTAVPARSTYPRGFLWDEGFHQLLISHWDRNISFEIIANWMDLMNINGWLPREQILGEEALSKVPAEFVNQISDNANPPALLLVLRELAANFEVDQRSGQGSEADVKFFRTLYPRLAVWFNWFNTTQIGKEPDSYYWRGRVDTDQKLNPPTLTSGMDDYPRASHPSDDERHVDLRCWIANASDAMALLARVAGIPYEEYKKYEVTSRNLGNLTRLNELHLDNETGRYYDYGNHTEKVKLVTNSSRDPITGLTVMESYRVVLAPPKLGWVPQFGYNSLFPFLMHILPADSPILGKHLDMLNDPQLMWTDYGLRSLGKTSSIYNKNNSYYEAPYWRGPVWININYLLLSSLHDYAQEAGPYQQNATDLYQTFRKNLIRNIVGQYQATGYIWEHYEDRSGGIGQGVHPFTGWSSLVLRVMAEMF